MAYRQYVDANTESPLSFNYPNVEFYRGIFHLAINILLNLSIEHQILTQDGAGNIVCELKRLDIRSFPHETVQHSIYRIRRVGYRVRVRALEEWEPDQPGQFYM